MTIERQIENALFLNEDLYFLTPTKELFETILIIFNKKFKNYVPNFRLSDWNINFWDRNEDKTFLYYVQNNSLYWGGDTINYPHLKQIHIIQEDMTIKDKLEEALIKGEEFYINTPTFDGFSYIINLLTSDFKSYVPRMRFDLYDYNMWSTHSENTYLFYWKNDNFAYGGKNATNDKNRYFLNLFNLKEEIIEHTYTISIGEYSGKLIIPKEALELLKTGTKIKIV